MSCAFCKTSKTFETTNDAMDWLHDEITATMHEQGYSDDDPKWQDVFDDRAYATLVAMCDHHHMTIDAL